MEQIVKPTNRLQDREAASRWAARMHARTDVLYLDTETTGIDDDAEIIDIAVIDSSGTVLLDSLVRPAGKIPQESTAIHGITDAMVSGARTWPSVYPDLARLLSNRSCIVYNAAFDRRVIKAANRRHRLPQISVNWHCAMHQYAAYVGEWSETYRNYRWHKLEKAARAVGSPMPVRHRALADALACRALVIGMASKQGRGQVVRPRRQRAVRPPGYAGTSRQTRPVTQSKRKIHAKVLIAMIMAGLLILYLAWTMIQGILA